MIKAKINAFLTAILLPGRIFVGALFFYSGFQKLIHPIEYFEISINRYEIIPDIFVRGVALVLPWIELIAGAFLVLGYLFIPSAIALALLTAMFQIILSQAIFRDLWIDDCGCFGAGFLKLDLWQSLKLDISLFAILLLIVLTKQDFWTLDRLLLKQSSPDRSKSYFLID